MKLYRFDPDVGKSIAQFDSHNVVISRILRINGRLSVNVMYLAENGIVGLHPAMDRQLFCVVQGQGLVRGAEPKRIEIESGQAVLWEAGELHETSTVSGLMAIVLEGDIPDLDAMMTPILAL